MIEVQCMVRLCFPIELKKGTLVCQSCFDWSIRSSLMKTWFHYWLVRYLSVGTIKWQEEEIHYTGFLSKLLETKLLQLLRFKHGQVGCTIYFPFRVWFILFFGLIFCVNNIALCVPDLLCKCFRIHWWWSAMSNWWYTWWY